MNISKENIDALNAVIKLTVEKDDYAKKVDDVLKDYRKRVNMPGFRPGKVPAGVVKKMYGKAVLADEVNKLVSESIHGYIVENKLDLLGEPLPSESQEVIDFDTAESFEFAFDVALAPEVEVKLTKREKLPLYKIEITDEMLATQVDSITGRFGTTEKVDEVTEKSMVKGNFAELNDKGEVVEEGITKEDAVISLNVIKDDAEKAKLLGAKAGDVITFNPTKAFPNESEITYMLGVEKEVAADLKSDFQFTITEVTEFKQPEMNQDLFDKAFGEGEVKTEEEFKERVKSDFANMLAMETEYRFTVDAKDKLMGKVDVDFPEAFLKRWLLATNRENEQMNEETLENEMPRFLEDLKWQLIRNSLIKASDLKVEEADVVEYAKKSARIQFMQYGLNNVPDEHLENYAKEMIQKEDQRRQMAEGAINDKVMDLIKESVKVEEKEISRDDFNKLFEK
ncbi:trigger factor [Carboxylicivirga linearis]|uniref:Trigger factor n=1 Tax=Carboxylicivirga linearis TaxID=1628157 RepID=A0ABS5JP00_9BACT|nr:trigger factor [Carboxylicivirga linearis]MBS2096644.1 trigger factor [Carboxylicivirga linearis]